MIFFTNRCADWRSDFPGRDGGQGGRYARRWSADGLTGYAGTAVGVVFTGVKPCGLKKISRLARHCEAKKTIWCAVSGCYAKIV